jgi:hypothetical protein
MLTIYEALEFLIEKGAGRTEIELARTIYGSVGYQQQVNPDCRRLAMGHKVERRGDSPPFRYYPARRP